MCVCVNIPDRCVVMKLFFLCKLTTIRVPILVIKRLKDYQISCGNRLSIPQLNNQNVHDILPSLLTENLEEYHFFKLKIP